MDRGKKLSRQIGRYLGSDKAEEQLAALLNALRSGLDGNALPAPLAAAARAALDPLEKLPAFLDIVDSSYQKYEDNVGIAERNIEISSNELMQANRSINSMVNCLGQGFLIFDATGICAPVYSKACQSLLEIAPAGKHIADVLRLNEAQKASLSFLLGMAFDSSSAMSFDEIMRLAPRRYAHSQGLHIQLDYKPEKTDGRLDRVVMVVSDMTREIEAQNLAEQRKNIFESIERILQDRQAFGAYIRHLVHMTDMLADLGSQPDWLTLSREVHTLKAGAGLFRLTQVMNELHGLESLLGGSTGKSRADGQAPDMAAINRYRELLLKEIDRIGGRLKTVLGVDVAKLEYESHADKETLYNFARYLKAQGHEQLQREYLRRVCAESLRSLLQPMNALLSDLAARLNKSIKPLYFTGSDVRIMPELYRGLLDSFMHLFRNMADHGIEPAAMRREMGKPEAGLIEINTGLHDAPGGQILRIVISDDGGGMDVERLRSKLKALEPDAHWQTRSDDEVLNSVLIRTLSTCDSATHYSGRGVGMGAVYDEIKKLGGTMKISSLPAKGASFTIEIPYRLELE